MQKINKTIRKFLILIVLIIVTISLGGLIGYQLSQKVSSENTSTPISYTTINLSDPHFLANKEYSVGGIDGAEIVTTKFLNLSDQKIQISTNTEKNKPLDKYLFKGGLSLDDLKIELQKLLEETAHKLKTTNGLDKYNNLLVDNINLIANNSFKLENKIIELGSVDIFMENCHFFNTLDLKYDASLKIYKFGKISEFETKLCDKYTVPENPFVTSCNDCMYYPVDKKHPLDSNYAIEVINADAIPGEQRFSKAAYGNLLDLYSAAKAAGYNMRLTSAYRSYQDQQEVYEGWVQYEMGFGKSRAQAESDANSYSALPGFSEHQLGTTADISSLDCIGIETVCHANELFWDWLGDHAYEYGFIMSYPMGKDELTGYIHEPWHYRFIGVELAKEFKDRYEQRSYLAEFLRNKKLY